MMKIIFAKSNILNERDRSLFLICKYSDLMRSFDKCRSIQASWHTLAITLSMHDCQQRHTDVYTYVLRHCRQCNRVASRIKLGATLYLCQGYTQHNSRGLYMCGAQQNHSLHISAWVHMYHTSSPFTRTFVRHGSQKAQTLTEEFYFRKHLNLIFQSGILFYPEYFLSKE